MTTRTGATGTAAASRKRPAVTLAPVVRTRVLPTRRGAQCWSAETTDGTWGFDRLEDTATSWEVVHRPTRTVVCDFLTSLRECRAYVASGEAAEDLERLLAQARTPLASP